MGECSQCGGNFVVCKCWAKDKDFVLTDEEIKSIIDKTGGFINRSDLGEPRDLTKELIDSVIDSLYAPRVDEYLNTRLLSDIYDSIEKEEKK
jgi:hypothetical protein